MPRDSSVHSMRRRVLGNAAGLLMLLAPACGPGDPAQTDARWTRPADLEPQLAALVDAQLQRIHERGQDGASVGRLGLIYEANRQWEAALQAYDAARALAPEEPLWSLHAALARANLGDAAGALELLRGVGPRFVHCAPLQYGLGELLLDSGELDAALAAFERTIAAAPSQPEGYAGKALVELRRGQAQQAHELLCRALELDPGFRQAWYPLGLALRALGRESEALPALERGREPRRRRMRDELNAQLAELAVTRDEVLERASAMLATGQAKQALVKLEVLARARGEDALVQFNLGTALLQCGRGPEAWAALERARALDPGLAGLDANLALAAVALGRSQAAREAIARALAREAGVSRTHVIDGIVRESAGDLEGALGARRKAVELDPRNGAARAELGRSLAMQGRWSEAEEQFRSQLELLPEDWRAHANLARVLAEQTRLPEARSALLSARKAAGADAAAAAELDPLAKVLGP